MQTKLNVRIDKQVVLAAIVCACLILVEAAAQAAQKSKAECLEEMESAMIEARAKYDGQLFKAHSDEEAVRIASNYRVLQQEIRERYRECLSGKSGSKTEKDEEKMRDAAINLVFMDKPEEVRRDALQLAEAAPALLQAIASEIIEDIVRDKSYDVAGFYEVVLKGKSEIVTVPLQPLKGRNTRFETNSSLPLKEVTLTNVVLFDRTALRVYLEKHPEIEKEFTVSKKKRCELFAAMVHNRAPLYSAEIQKKLGVTVTADPHFAQTLQLLPADVRYTTVIDARTHELFEKILATILGAPDSSAKNLAILELLYEMWPRFGAAGEAEFRRLLAKRTAAEFEGAKQHGGLISPFLYRRVVDCDFAEIVDLKSKNADSDKINARQKRIIEVMRDSVRGRSPNDALIALKESGFLNVAFMLELRDLAGVDTAGTFKDLIPPPPGMVQVDRNRRSDSEPKMLSSGYIVNAVSEHPENALKVLNENLGPSPENNGNRATVRDYLTKNSRGKPDYGAEFLMAVPKSDRAAVAKYILSLEAETNAALIARGLRGGMSGLEVCAQIKDLPGTKPGVTWERRSEAVVYYNIILREESEKELDLKDSQMIRQRAPKR